jgi:hypothetical protein
MRGEDLRHVEPRLVMAIVGRMSAAGDLVGEDLADEVAPGVERHDPLGVAHCGCGPMPTADGCW